MAPAARLAGSSLDAEQELRRDQDARQRLLDARFEVGALAALVVEADQRRDVGGGDAGRDTPCAPALVRIVRAHAASSAAAGGAAVHR